MEKKERLSNTNVDSGISTEIPREINSKSVIYWSEHYKMLKGVKEGGAIRTKARKFVELGLIEYDKEDKCYLCKPIIGYNKTTYRLFWDKAHLKYKGDGYGEFECSCQYNQTTFKMCSHCLALYMQLKIWNWNRRRDKELHPELYEKK